MADIQKAVQTTLDELRFVITKGLDEQQARRVVHSFETEILPFRLRQAVGDNPEQLAGRVEVVVEDYAKRLAGLNAAQKENLVKNLSVFARVEAVSEQILMLAIAKSKNEAVNDNEAAMMLARFKSLESEIKRLAPETQKEMSDVLSETSVDFMYVLGASNSVSLRLSHTLGEAPAAAPKKRQCGECGKEVSPEATMCPRCGSPLDGSSQPAAQPVKENPPKAPADPGPVTRPTETRPTGPIPGLCKKCGAQLDPGKKFCTKCGTPVT